MTSRLTGLDVGRLGHVAKTTKSPALLGYRPSVGWRREAGAWFGHLSPSGRSGRVRRSASADRTQSASSSSTPCSTSSYRCPSRSVSYSYRSTSGSHSVTSSWPGSSASGTPGACSHPVVTMLRSCGRTDRRGQARRPRGASTDLLLPGLSVGLRLGALLRRQRPDVDGPGHLCGAHDRTRGLDDQLHHLSAGGACAASGVTGGDAAGDCRAAGSSAASPTARCSRGRWAPESRSSASS